MKRLILDDGNTVIIQRTSEQWEISTVSLVFLDWIRETFGNSEGDEWRLTYYGGSMSLIQSHSERIITMAILRWA
jgi:hypothetical protein